MAKKQAPHLATIEALLVWLRSQRVPCVLVGGVAASLLARPRSTRDVDALIDAPETRWESILEGGKKHGFVPRASDAIAFARDHRVLALRHQATGIDVDLVVAGIPLEREIIGRRCVKTVAGIRLPLPTPEDLLIMKAIARRPRDMADIEAILSATPMLDQQRVRKWVRAFAEAMEAPEIISGLEAILTRFRSAPQ